MQNIFEDIEKSLINAFLSLNVTPLKRLDDMVIYSYNYKDEMIDELKKVFDKIKSTEISSLSVKESKCNYCYPTGKAYSFHHPETDEFIIRYVIFKESNSFFRIEECKNKPIPDGENGMPF